MRDFTKNVNFPARHGGFDVNMLERELTNAYNDCLFDGELDKEMMLDRALKAIFQDDKRRGYYKNERFDEAYGSLLRQDDPFDREVEKIKKKLKKKYKKRIQELEYRLAMKELESHAQRLEEQERKPRQLTTRELELKMSQEIRDAHGGMTHYEIFLYYNKQKGE